MGSHCTYNKIQILARVSVTGPCLPSRCSPPFGPRAEMTRPDGPSSSCGGQLLLILQACVYIPWRCFPRHSDYFSITALGLIPFELSSQCVIPGLLVYLLILCIFSGYKFEEGRNNMQYLAGYLAHGRYNK